MAMICQFCAANIGTGPHKTWCPVVEPRGYTGVAEGFAAMLAQRPLSSEARRLYENARQVDDWP